MKALPPTLHLLRCLFSSFTSAVQKALSWLSVTYRFLLHEPFSVKEWKPGRLWIFIAFLETSNTALINGTNPCLGLKTIFCPLRHFYLAKKQKQKQKNHLEKLTFGLNEFIVLSKNKCSTPTKSMKFATDLGEAIVLPQHFEQRGCLAITSQNSIFLTTVSTAVATVKHEQPFNLGREYPSLLKHYTSCIFNSVFVKNISNISQPSQVLTVRICC